MEVCVDDRSLEVKRLWCYCNLPDNTIRLHLLSDCDNLTRSRYFFWIEWHLFDMLWLRLLKVYVRWKVRVEDLRADLGLFVRDFKHLDILAHAV